MQKPCLEKKTFTLNQNYIVIIYIYIYVASSIFNLEELVHLLG